MLLNPKGKGRGMVRPVLRAVKDRAATGCTWRRMKPQPWAGKRGSVVEVIEGNGMVANRVERLRGPKKGANRKT